MARRSKAREVIAGIADDPTFGPVVVFGHGGTAVELVDDKSLALPPLDLRLAHEMIGRTRVSRVLKAYREVPAADERALRSEEHTSELQSLMRISYAVFCLKQTNTK